MWKFISAIYESHWNNLFIDNNKSTFRNKIKSKFNLQVNKPQASLKEKKIAKLTFMSFLPSSILAKSLKEINKLSKYFKKNINAPQKKLYVQASSSSKQTNSFSTSNITMKTLKIKETFPNLLNKKIDLVQKIINSSNVKPKPKINMTTKGLSHKQVIVLMNNKKFIKDSSIHVTNINCAFKNIWSNIIADFI